MDMKEHISFIKNNLLLMLNAKSVDEVVGMTKVLLSYIEKVNLQPIEVFIPSIKEGMKIALIKELRTKFNLGLTEAKYMSEKFPMPMHTTDNVAEAVELKRQFEKYATVQLKGLTPTMEVLYGEK